ncbi:acyl-CoA N-acyltransferase [Coemansia reversa NRRL 1564]|uniref:Histone acetyltransferase type B catalytic subunit n=1 Tax=Coemansia reversa (strain ATCC 12441 / NRRL 1564) TaxID=763665 RepID=A0A2G5BDW5_COERN|nr:acyl-CoA N-acyltransferase [Coemansia reversa NRRL 1564]|eukprot:PIA17203.1 acyl-CoA N-acyltransferase [Coemansia reversa NRRL 1564]
MDAGLAATASQWATETNSAVQIRLFSAETQSGTLKALNSDMEQEVEELNDSGMEEEDGADVVQFHPAFTYPIYGEHERVFGYKGLKINLNYAAGSLATYFEVEYAKRIDQMESSSVISLKPDNVDEPMRAVLATEAVCQTREEFAQCVAHDTREFRPIGRKVHEYKEQSKGQEQQQYGEGISYEIYESEFENAEFGKYHERLQTMVLFFIEGAQFIDSSDERWRVFTLFERLNLNGVVSYSLVGFCTMYRFYHWPDQWRARISQFLILPPFQGHGHGSALYRHIYSAILADAEYADLTVEDPSEAFDDMRDRNDMRYLLDHGAFDRISSAPVDCKTVLELQHRFKLSKRQMIRCLEMALLQKIGSSGAALAQSEDFRHFSLFVKRRIYAQNTDLLQDLEDDEKKKKVAESFAAVVDDYRRVLSLL